MPFTPEEAEKIAAHLTRWVGACSVCRAEDWDIAGDHAEWPVVTAPPRLGQVPSPPGPQTPMVIPVVVIVCKRCFHAVPFAWMGIRNKT